MIVDHTRKETVCLDGRLLKGEKDENGIILEQHWKQRHLLDAYFRSDHFTALLGAMKLLAVDWEMAINNGAPEKANAAVINARGS